METVGSRVLKLFDFMLARDLRYDEGVEGVGGSWNSQPGWGESWNSTLSEAHSPSPPPTRLPTHPTQWHKDRRVGYESERI